MAYSDQHKSAKLIEQIVITDGDEGKTTYTITYHSNDPHRPFHAKWHSSIGGSGFGITMQHETLGKAQRWLLKQHRETDGPAPDFKNSQFDSQLPPPKSG